VPIGKRLPLLALHVGTRGVDRALSVARIALQFLP
jgi:hypothetical protein